MTHETMTCETFTELLGAMLEGDLDPSMQAAAEAHAAGCAACASLRADLLRISADASRLPVLAPPRDLWEGISERIESKVLPISAPTRSAHVARPPRPHWVRQALLAAGLVFVTAGVTWVATNRANERSTAQQVAAGSRVQQSDSSLGMVASDNRGGSRPAVSSPTSELAAGEEARVAVSEGTRPGTRPSSTGERASDGGQRPQTTATSERRLAPRGTAQLASSRLPEAAREVEAVYGGEIQRLYDIMAQRKSELDPATVKVIEDNLAIIDSAIVQSRRAIARDPNSGLLMEQLNSILDRKVGLLRTAAMLPARS